MKKIFYLASIAALAFSSCAKDETTEAALGTVGGSKIVAAMEADDTRTELVENNGAYSFVWKGGDILSVYEDINSGTDAKYLMSGVAFELEPSASGQATGAFNSKVGELQEDVNYVALYPKAGSSITGGPVWTKEIKIGNTTHKKQFDYSKVKMTVPAEQDYVPGSFDNNTVPAISTSFAVNGEGEATVQMQPVVDYLMVDIQSTEPIDEISLSLVDNAKFDNKGNLTNGTSIAITGEGALEAYTVNGKVRYILTNTGMTGKFITLKTNNLGDNVSLAKANTYVFAIPGGILGAGNTDLVAELSIDGKKYYSTNANLNYYLNAAYEPQYRKAGTQGGNTLPVYNRNRENGIFWFNDADAPVVHNPNNDFLIQNEVDLFAYLANYATLYVDAYVEEGATLNVSKANMDAILKKLDSYVNYSVNKDLYPNAYKDIYTVINNYVKVNGDGVFPTLANFNKEFKGNGAVIANIDRPLSSKNGLFGDIYGDGKVSNLTLSNIDALSWDDKDDEDDDDKLIEKGYILASDVWGTLKNITVEGLDGLAVAKSANVDNFNAIKIGAAGVGEVEHILEGALTMDKKFSISAEKWEALNDVEISVFHEIKPAAAHAVATLPAGADYAKFTCGVDNTTDAAKVVSVLIGDVSYWTGGKIEPAKLTYEYYNTNMGNTYNAYKAIQYAEELAWGAVKAYLVRGINLNGANELNWATTNLNALYGAGNTISDLAMEVEGAGATGNVAPFAVPSVSAVNFDGISIKIVTADGKAVSKKISGVSDGITSATSVAVNNLSINAVPAKGNYTVAYDNTTNVLVGWITAVTADAKMTGVTVSNVQSNVMGIAGMVSTMGLTKTNSLFDGCGVTGTNTFAQGQAAQNEFAYFKGTNNNVVGSIVGYVYNNAGVDTAVRFDNYVGAKPAFLYATQAGSIINVNYNGTTDVTLENPADM